MEKVFSVDTLPWQELRGLPGARGFEFKALTDDSYTGVAVLLERYVDMEKVKTATLVSATR